MASPTSTSNSTPTPTPPPPPPPHHHHNPSPTTSNPSTSSPKPTKKAQPLPWTHQETMNLIQAYQEKWYSLKKGQLKASQWEEVAITVAARCGFDEPSKTSTQCRHKIEKLRKRYRAERVKPYPNNSWQYFDLMDRMERGPFPLTAQPISAVNFQHQYSNNCNNNNNNNYEFDASNDESDSYEENLSYAVDVRRNKSKSINHILHGETGISSNNLSSNRMLMDRGNERELRGMRDSMGRKRKGYYENEGSDDEEEEEEEEDVEEGDEGEGEGFGDGGIKLAAEIRGFAENFMRVEKKKIEMMRETERCRMEMEKKRMEMILESQRKIVDTIGRAFGTQKKVKIGQDM